MLVITYGSIINFPVRWWSPSPGSWRPAQPDRQSDHREVGKIVQFLPVP